MSLWEKSFPRKQFDALDTLEAAIIWMIIGFGVGIVLGGVAGLIHLYAK